MAQGLQKVTSQKLTSKRLCLLVHWRGVAGILQASCFCFSSVPGAALGSTLALS